MTCRFEKKEQHQQTQCNSNLGLGFCGDGFVRIGGGNRRHYFPSYFLFFGAVVDSLVVLV